MTTLGPYAALDHVFTVTVTNGHDPVLSRLLAPLATGRAPTVAYELRLPADGAEGWLQTPSRRLAKEHPSSLHSRLVVDVGTEALASVTDPVVHGCLLEIDGRGVLVAGRSGTGKSTLAARLLADGAGLVTEDLTVIAVDGRVRPYPRPVALSSTAFPVLGREVPPDDCGCGCMKYVLHAEDLGGHLADPVDVALVVLCDRGSTGVTRRTLGWTLASLFDQASLANARDPEGLGRVASALAGAPCVELGTADLDAAARAVGPLLDERPEAVTVAVERLHGATALYVDGEVVIHADDRVHHLDAAATAVWVLRSEGLSATEVAEELGLPAEVAHETIGRLQDVAVPAARS